LKFDISLLKALASVTRLNLLKTLALRRMTLSELSKSQDMHVSTIKDHLEILKSVDLVSICDDGHKWKYYDLTTSGKYVVLPSKKEIEILLPISLVFILVGLKNQLFNALSFARGGGLQSEMMASVEKSADLVISASSEALDVSDSAIKSVSVLPDIYTILLTFGVVIFVYVCIRLLLRVKT